ncbi:MAG: DNA-directed RNA polymerase subunit K [Nitrososphaeraceae archaeon]
MAQKISKISDQNSNNSADEGLDKANKNDIDSSKTKSSSSKSKSKTKSSSSKSKTDLESNEEPKSTRTEEFVVYNEPEFESKEITGKNKEILIGPNSLTRFEKARITGARSLQLSYGAPLMIHVDTADFSSISIAIEELDKKVLPISIRRILPNGLYQDIPLDWLKL